MNTMKCPVIPGGPSAEEKKRSGVKHFWGAVQSTHNDHRSSRH